MTVFSYVGMAKLTVKSLDYYILNTVIANHWKDLGTELLKEEYLHQLITIEAKYNSDVKNCCRAMFNYWLQVDYEAKWNQLISALEEIHLNVLAQKIRNHVFKGIIFS